MRTVLVATAAVLVLSAVFAGGAGAKCSVTCLNHRVKQLSSALIKAEKTIASLSKTVTQQGQAIAGQGAAISSLTKGNEFVNFLEGCLFQLPLNQYGESEGEEGYLYETPTEAFKTTALDVVPEGGAVGAWFLINGCNPLETASIKAAARRIR